MLVFLFIHKLGLGYLRNILLILCSIKVVQSCQVSDIPGKVSAVTLLLQACYECPAMKLLLWEHCCETPALGHCYEAPAMEACYTVPEFDDTPECVICLSKITPVVMMLSNPTA